MGDPSEEEVAAFLLDIEQRDYVQVLGAWGRIPSGKDT